MLSKREKEILRLMAHNETSAEIGDLLFISSLTAETHKRNIRNKLNVISNFELAQYARAFDLI
ncbi:MAG: helix-turn-helix transcriptional regulator [Daejeonella sp.]|uniref:response regulator transcription factor n=1 Tax=Daejeonella sp. TaxID=2805397 RepID=UPI003C744622